MSVRYFSEIVQAVSEEFGVSRADIMVPSRSTKDIAWARQVAMYMVRWMTDESWSKIAKAFKRDRTTVRHAFEKVSMWRGEGEDLDELLTNMERSIRGNANRVI